MSKIPSLNKIQLAQEASYGNGDTADIQPAGITVVNITPRVEVEQIVDKRGNTMPAVDAIVKRRWSEGSIEGLLDYNRAMLWLDAMFGYDATSPHTYVGSLDWVDETEKSLALYYGQSGMTYKIAGVLPSELRFSVSNGEPMMFNFGFFGQAVESGSFAALTDDTPEFAYGYDSSIYIDSGLDATIGTTALADTAFRVEAVINNDRQPVWHLGDQEPDSYRNGKWGGSLNLVLEADATTLAHLLNIIDATSAAEGFVVRVRTTDGTNTLDIDFAGVCVNTPTLITDNDGIVTVEMELMPQYGSDLGNCWGATLTIG